MLAAQVGLAAKHQRWWCCWGLILCACEAGHLVPDQQAREVVRLRCGRQRAGQAQRARAEDVREQAQRGIAAPRHLQAARKGGVVGRGCGLHGLAQNGVAAQRGKHIARHKGVELLDAPPACQHPFAVGAGQADEHGSIRRQRKARQYAQHLGLFTTHHIGQRVLLQEARHDVQRRAIAPCHQRQAPRQCIERGGRGQVFGLAPALGAAHHAAGQQGQAGCGGQPVATGVLQCALKGGAGLGVVHAGGGWGQIHDAPGAVAGLLHGAGRIHAERAQRGGAPVQGDEARFSGHQITHRRHGCSV